MKVNVISHITLNVFRVVLCSGLICNASLSMPFDSNSGVHNAGTRYLNAAIKLIDSSVSNREARTIPLEEPCGKGYELIGIVWPGKVGGTAAVEVTGWLFDQSGTLDA
ncbi:hypothetical protein AVEN_42693-1 [Araneus ventricosus]|uniref:Uncharacterized protein n=1 Tax=Araneus ventricosus TaxID=182803 RepID=A0A4Y2BMG5_ARAVE|nr:hypothetical protein AVEN_42693-1 [Araneus ventricosus]